MYYHTVPPFKYKRRILCLPGGDRDSRGRCCLEGVHLSRWFDSNMSRQRILGGFFFFLSLF